MRLRIIFPVLLPSAVVSIRFQSFTGAQTIVADLVIVNANIRTMDAKRPTAQGLAVYGNHIAAVAER